VQALQVRNHGGVGQQGLHLAHTVITTGKHELRGHARPLNQSSGRRPGSERGSRDELANANQEADGEQP
jgi:hypothetical protein